MRYCSKCKKLIVSDEYKCTCGKKLTDKTDGNSPIKLISAASPEKDRIKAALDDAKIPYSVQIEKDPTNVTSAPGFETADYTFFVPLGVCKKAIDVVMGISSMELPEYYDELETLGEFEWKEMSPLKRNVIRTLSAIGFIVLVWLCVAGVDFIAERVTSFFK